MECHREWLFQTVLDKNKRIFEVPVYQRNYDWSNLQCEKLYQDIINAHLKDHKHFLGTIVYIVGEYGSSLEKSMVIDGQQRITTVYILLKALYDVSKDISASIVQHIKNVMYNENCEEKYKVKLKPINSDNKQLLLLLNANLDDMDRNSNIYKNYILLRDLIIESVNSGLEPKDILDGISKLEVVEIILDKSDGDEPQKIFESINSTGLDLSLADKIRNYLLMDDNNQEYLYESYWLEIEKNVGYYNLQDFFINHLNFRISKSVKKDNAYILFKDYCDDNNLSHQDVLKELKKTSKYYGAFIGKKTPYNKKITDCLTAFNTIKQTTVLPLIFRILNDFEDDHIDEGTLCNVLNYLLTYYIRITACEINKNLSKFMKSLYDRVIDGSYDDYYKKFVVFLNDCNTKSRMPSDHDFKEAIKYNQLYKKPICKFVLSTIENSTKEHIDINDLTIEHILPQKENAAVWKKEVGEEYSYVYKTYLHTLGNLTITGYNSELNTKSFADKKAIIKKYSKANILNKEVLSADRWNEKSILHRAEILSNILINKFKYLEWHREEDISKSLDFDINTEVDVTKTKPDSFAFVGEVVKVKSWVDILSKFICIAYDLDNELFARLAQSDYSILDIGHICISNDNRKLCRGRQINSSGIYFETNLSEKNILLFIRDLLNQMNLEVDDFSFSLLEVPFVINDETTWCKGKISVAKLFYKFVIDLNRNNKLSSLEIDQLKTKEYTRKLFSSTSYPALADNRTDHMGKSSIKRYRAEPFSFNGESVFISTQFYESDREAVIEWYKKHL